MTKLQAFELSPVDTLFFRDARPMQAGAGSGGHGANWPMPTVMHEAIRTKLLCLAGELSADKKKTHKKTGTKCPRVKNVASDLFRSLRTVGPFPLRDSQLYMATPSDIVPGKEKVSIFAPVLNPGGATNLPYSWMKPVASRAGPTKETLPVWVTLEFFRQYLNSTGQMERPESVNLYETEHRIGIKIDHATGTAEDRKLFPSEHLRLVCGTRIWFTATLSQRDDQYNPVPIEHLVGNCIPLGGESRLARLFEGRSDMLDTLTENKPRRMRIKWVTVTPAVFCGGWRPNWIEPEEGRVMLRDGDTRRLGSEDRESWRRRIRSFPPATAKLVAARIPKPIHFSGWDVVSKGPKHTMLAVPAGAVYYFEAGSEQDAETLVQALHCRTHSDFFGEKGMGLGFCGTWEPLDA